MSYWIQHRLKNIEEAFTAQYCLAIEKVSDFITQQFRAGKKILICGNGGSAADTQHIAAEFVGRFLRERKGLPAIALAANSAILTALTNDYNFETVFSRQVEALGQPGDILWAISTSGTSPNVVRALKTAKILGLICIGMAGNNGGNLTELVDYSLFVEQKFTPYVQEIHLITYHQICEQVERQFLAETEANIQLAS